MIINTKKNKGSHLNVIYYLRIYAYNLNVKNAKKYIK